MLDIDFVVLVVFLDVVVLIDPNVDNDAGKGCRCAKVGVGVLGEEDVHLHDYVKQTNVKSRGRTLTEEYVKCAVTEIFPPFLVLFFFTKAVPHPTR